MKTFRMIRGPATCLCFFFFLSFFAELLPKNHRFCKLRHFYGLPVDQQYGEAGLILPLQNKLYCEMHKSELTTCLSLQRHLSLNRNIKPGMDFGKLLLLNKKQKRLVTSRHKNLCLHQWSWSEASEQLSFLRIKISQNLSLSSYFPPWKLDILQEPGETSFPLSNREIPDWKRYRRSRLCSKVPRWVATTADIGKMWDVCAFHGAAIGQEIQK